MSSAPPPSNSPSLPPPANASRDLLSPVPAPSFDALLRHLRIQVARVLHLPQHSQANEEPALVSLANRALARYPNPDRSTLPPPLLQIDAYQRSSNPTESLSKYLDARRAILALDADDPMDSPDKDAIGDPAADTSLDAPRDSDEDAIGSDHPRSPSFGPSAHSPLAPHRLLEPRLPTPTPSSPRPTSGTAANSTAMSSPEPRSTLSAPPRANLPADRKKPAAPPDSVNHTYTGDDRCTNCIARNNPTCVVNSSRQRCDSCFLKRHRCSKVPTPPTRPSRESNAASAKSASTSKAKAPAAGAGGEHTRRTASTRSSRRLPSPSSSSSLTDAPTTTNGAESASARAQKRKRPADVEDTKRPEPAPKRPTRPTRPSAAGAAAPAASTSASASAPVARPPAQKRERPPVQNGIGAGASSASASNPLNALAASASRAPRAPAVPVNANAPATAAGAGGGAPLARRQQLQQYNEKLQVLQGIMHMVQNSIKDLQDLITADINGTR